MRIDVGMRVLLITILSFWTAGCGSGSHEPLLVSLAQAQKASGLSVAMVDSNGVLYTSATLPGRVAPLRARPPTAAVGETGSFDRSGKLLLVLAPGGLLVADLGRGTERRVPGLWATERPAVHEGTAQILVTGTLQGQQGLYHLTLSDLSPRLIAPRGSSPSWSRNGDVFLFVEDGHAILQSIVTGIRKNLVPAVGAALSDIGEVAYVTSSGDLYVMDMRGSAPGRRLAREVDLLAPLDWAPGGEFLQCVMRERRRFAGWFIEEPGRAVVMDRLGHTADVIQFGVGFPHQFLGRTHLPAWSAGRK